MWEMSRLFGSVGYPVSRFSFPVPGFLFLVSCFSFLVSRFSRDGRGKVCDNPFFLDFAAVLQIENYFSKSKGFGIRIPDLDRLFVKMIAIEHFCLHLDKNGQFWSRILSKCRFGQISRRLQWQCSLTSKLTL